ncbi:MAG: hypothetical protein HY670_09385 [Chloroflexi bacterium]|nr:hypothetical protein [Chloroflexota bacterium]
MATKKIYCAVCQKMVTGKEQKTGSERRILCSRCNTVLRAWNGVAWRFAREGD